MDNFGHRTGRTADRSRPGDAPAGDGIPNLVKYALGLDAFAFGTPGRVSAGTISAAGQQFLSVTYTRPEPPPADLTYAVELSPSLSPAVWTTNGIIVISNNVNTGFSTIATRDPEPVGSAGQKFMRFRLSRP